MTWYHHTALTALLLLSSDFFSVVQSSRLVQEGCPSGRSPVHDRTLRGISRSTQATTIINNGVIMLGINDEGNLDVPGSIPDGHDSSTGIGLKFFRDGEWFDSTSYGCECEGFGVSAKKTDNTSFWAGANVSGGGVTNLSASPIISDGSTATSVASVTSGPLSVKHEFMPSSSTPNMYEVKVTLQNTSTTETLTELRYRRTMDWDIPPTPFNECVSIFYNDQPKDLEYATDDGFESPNPLIDTSNSGLDFSCPTGGSPCPVFDSGPTDHGANFQFLFKEDDGVTNVSLPPGETLEFFIFYGAATNKLAADGALTAVGAELASYGYAPGSTGCSATNDGSPGVYIFAFKGVGASTIFSPEPSSSVSPSSVPSSKPSALPSGQPSLTPSVSPSSVPSASPSTSPSALPSVLPSLSAAPSTSNMPSSTPSCVPSEEPSESPSVSQRPSNAPSVSNAPTKAGKGGKGKNRAMKETSKSPKKSKEPKWGKGIKSQKCAN
jgi:hypothetical protein